MNPLCAIPLAMQKKFHNHQDDFVTWLHSLPIIDVILSASVYSSSICGAVFQLCFHKCNQVLLYLLITLENFLGLQISQISQNFKLLGLQI